MKKYANELIRAGEAGDAIPIHAGRVWRSALAIVLLTVGLVAVGRSDTVHAALTDVFEASQVIIGSYPVAGPLLFVALAALSAMLAFASVAVVVPLAVYTWGAPLSILLLWVGWFLGGMFTYLAGRYGGRTVARWLAADAVLRRIEQRMGPSMSFGMVLLCQLALPSEIPGYVFGLVRYSVSKYLLALGLVELLYALATVQLGASFVEQSAGMVLATGLTVVMVSIAAFYLFQKKF